MKYKEFKALQPQWEKIRELQEKNKRYSKQMTKFYTDVLKLMLEHVLPAYKWSVRVQEGEAPTIYIEDGGGERRLEIEKALEFAHGEVGMEAPDEWVKVKGIKELVLFGAGWERDDLCGCYFLCANSYDTLAKLMKKYGLQRVDQVDQ
jgi:hypothetical protein